MVGLLLKNVIISGSVGNMWFCSVIFLFPCFRSTYPGGWVSLLPPPEERRISEWRHGEKCQGVHTSRLLSRHGPGGPRYQEVRRPSSRITELATQCRSVLKSKPQSNYISYRNKNLTYWKFWYNMHRIHIHSSLNVEDITINQRSVSIVLDMKRYI